MVLSSWLAALCKQLLYFKVTARYLGSDCGLKLGRQAAWRPGKRDLNHVPSSCLAGFLLSVVRLCVMLSLCCQAAWWHRVVSGGHLAFRSSCLAGALVAFGRQAAWWPGAHYELVSTSYLVALSRQSLRAVTARDLGSISYTVAELLGGCLLCDVDVSAGVFTLVDFYFHVAGLQPAFEEAQQQAAAAGGHYASEAQATPRVDVGDPP